MAGRRGSEPANYVARLSEWADAHLSLLRNVSTGMAITGVILLAKSVKMDLQAGCLQGLAFLRKDLGEQRERRFGKEAKSWFRFSCSTGQIYVASPWDTGLTTKFTNALEIPIEFIEKNVKLRGRLHQITEQGLEIEHVPIILPIISSLQRRWHTDGLLLVRLAGVELTPEGAMWLKKELKPSQMMWFQLLRRQEVTLDCRVVVSKGRFSSLCLNEEILRQGLGRAVPVEGLSHKSRIYWKLHKGLLQAELKAVKRNRGIWKEATFLEKLREHVNNNKYIQKLKQFATWLRIRP